MGMKYSFDAKPEFARRSSAIFHEARLELLNAVEIIGSCRTHIISFLFDRTSRHT